MEETLMAAETNNRSQNPNQPPAVPPPAPGTHIRTGGAPAAAPGGAGAAARMARPQKEKALNCPRCNSTDTKFCYYNNYSLLQPRYFCKTCHRYWTEGGSLRNVPVGGGSRKKKDAGAGSSSAASSATAPAPAMTSSGSGTTNPVVGLAAKNPTLTHEGANARELELAFKLPCHDGGRGLLPPGEFPAFPSLETCGGACDDGDAGSRDVGVLSAMDLLRSTGCYVPLQRVQLGNAAAAFALGEFRMPPVPAPASRRFSLDTGFQRGEEESAAGSLLSLFEDLTLAAGADGGANAGADQYDAGKDEGGHGGDGEASSALRFVADKRWS